jgi:hypothetical protein
VLNKSFRVMIATTTAACLLASGCGTTRPSPEPDDPCDQYRRPLIKVQEDAAKTWVSGTVVVSFVAALAGAACLASGGSKAVCAAVVAGFLATGVAVVYWKEKREEAKNREELQAVLDGEAGDARTRFNPAKVALQQLTACRTQQIGDLDRRLRALGQQAEDRLQNIVAIKADLDHVMGHVSQDQALINEILGRADQRATEIAETKARSLGVTLDEYEKRAMLGANKEPPAQLRREVKRVKTDNEDSQKALNEQAIALREELDILSGGPVSAWLGGKIEARLLRAIRAGA